MLVDAEVRENSAFAHGRNRVTHSLLAGVEVTELLDYGCGQAKFALAAADELGLTVHACDTDSHLVAELTRNYGANVDFFAISESEPVLPLADGQLSAVTCCDVLEHMPPSLRRTALLEMRRVLADDGVLIVTTPHKGLFSALDPENAKFYFPRVHRYVFALTKGRERYQSRYGGERFGNFSAGAERHVHFSARELSRILSDTGFRVEQIRYFTLIYPVIRTLLWVAEGLALRGLPGAVALRERCWAVYRWDADLEPGPLACGIAIRARPAAVLTPRR